MRPKDSSSGVCIYTFVSRGDFSVSRQDMVGAGVRHSDARIKVHTKFFGRVFFCCFLFFAYVERVSA